MKKVLVTNLGNQYEILVDDEDYNKVIEFNWFLRNGYPCNDTKGYMHNFIMGIYRGIDHINRDRLDNRKSNLRLATGSQNNANRNKQDKRKTTSLFKGVYWDRGKWKAQITVNYQTKHLGRFSDEWEAAQAYNEAAKVNFGEFALLNVRREE